MVLGTVWSGRRIGSGDRTMKKEFGMTGFLWRKLRRKKWMMLCMLLGNLLFMAVISSYPMFRDASFQRMMTDEFMQAGINNGSWPALVRMEYSKNKNRQGADFNRMNQYITEEMQNMGVPVAKDICSITLQEEIANPLIARQEASDKRLRLSAVSGLGEYITVTMGRMPADTVAQDGFLEVMVSETAAEYLDILLDEEFTLPNLKTRDGQEVKIRVVGVFNPADSEDPYWTTFDNEETKAYLVMEQFEKAFLGDGEIPYGLQVVWYEMLDYTTMTPKQAREIGQYIKGLLESEEYGKYFKETGYQEILDNYNNKARRAESTLLILMVPVVLLLCAFLYMITNQMLQMEQSEISLLKSRGAGRMQILGLYLRQAALINIITVFLGIPLGKQLCTLLGSTGAFLRFSVDRVLPVRIVPQVWLWILPAVLFSLIWMVLPVWKYSQVSIVEQKRSRNKKQASFWKKWYLDLVCLGVSLYGYFSFGKAEENVVKQVVEGQAMDPLLYLSMALFLLGLGLFFLRIRPWLLKLVWMIFNRSFSPAGYIAGAEAVRTGKRQEFVMLFFVLTMAIGIESAAIARTISVNAENNETYLTGADAVWKEVWKTNSAAVASTEGAEFKYYEPDFGRYEEIQGVNKATKVLLADGQAKWGRKQQAVTIMGIRNSEFATVTNMPEGLLPCEYEDYLSILAASKDAVIVSENFHTKQGLNLGDEIRITVNGASEEITGVIYGFFPYWPSYVPVEYTLGMDGDVAEEVQYQIVGNLNHFQSQWGVLPYEVWMDVIDSDALAQYEEEHTELNLSKAISLEEEMENIRTDTLFQGTNGILTMSYLVILILCAAGYLIYWILSIQSRELLFGVLRAMGMRKSEIIWMLIQEQIFSGLYAMLAGTLAGLIGTSMFVPLIQRVYAAADQVLPLQFTVWKEDVFQLLGMEIGVMIVCLLIVARIANKLNITKALKLGED